MFLGLMDINYECQHFECWRFGLQNLYNFFFFSKSKFKCLKFEYLNSSLFSLENESKCDICI